MSGRLPAENIGHLYVLETPDENENIISRVGFLFCFCFSDKCDMCLRVVGGNNSIFNDIYK